MYLYDIDGSVIGVTDLRAYCLLAAQVTSTSKLPDSTDVLSGCVAREPMALQQSLQVVMQVLCQLAHLQLGEGTS